jgi:hypothetical protein
MMLREKIQRVLAEVKDCLDLPNPEEVNIIHEDKASLTLEWRQSSTNLPVRVKGVFLDGEWKVQYVNRP